MLPAKPILNKIPADHFFLALTERKRDSFNGISKLDHSLQCATRAYNDNRNDQYIFAALMHDIAEPFAPHNHAKAAAELIRPYVSPAMYTMVYEHDDVMDRYFWKTKPMDRKSFSGMTYEFCELYDYPAFDPKYCYMSMNEFEDLVRKVCV